MPRPGAAPTRVLTGSTRMLAGLTLVLAGPLLAACDAGGESPTRVSERGASRGGSPSAGPGTSPDLIPTSTPAPRRRRVRDRPPAGGAAGPGPRGGIVAEEPSEEEDPDERLRRALAQSFGTPTACLSDQTRDRLEDELAVHLSVRVMGSGRVLSAQVSGAGLSAEDRECMVARAEGLRLPGPIEGAPRTVSTTVRYEVQDSRVTVSERGDPYVTFAPGGEDGEPPPPREYGPGTVHPDSTLPPAGSTEGRPAGSVAPSSTLPALAEPGPAPGAVPPAHTLPATGD